MNGRKLKRCIDRTAEFYQRIGFRFSICGGMLGEIFDLSFDSVYPDDPGIYMAVFLDKVPEQKYRNILNYQTAKRKEIALWIFNKNIKNDSGKCATFRIRGNKIVEFPRNLPIEKVLSSPPKRGAGSLKE